MPEPVVRYPYFTENILGDILSLFIVFDEANKQSENNRVVVYKNSIEWCGISLDKSF